jgi:hypothetical protein
MKALIKRTRTTLKQLNPYYWFDELLNEFEIELKEFKYK